MSPGVVLLLCFQPGASFNEGAKFYSVNRSRLGLIFHLRESI